MPLTIASIMFAALSGGFTALGIAQGVLPEADGAVPEWGVVTLAAVGGGLVPAIVIILGDALGMSGDAADRYHDQQ